MAELNQIKREIEEERCDGAENNCQIFFRRVTCKPETNVTVKQEPLSPSDLMPSLADVKPAIKPKVEIVRNRSYTIERSYKRPSSCLESPEFIIDNKLPMVQIHSAYLIGEYQAPPIKIAKLKRSPAPRNYRSEKSFRCDVCRKIFISLNGLLIHKRIHTTVEWRALSDLDGLQQWQYNRMIARNNIMNSTFAVRNSAPEPFHFGRQDEDEDNEGDFQGYLRM